MLNDSRRPWFLCHVCFLLQTVNRKKVTVTFALLCFCDVRYGVGVPADTSLTCSKESGASSTALQRTAGGHRLESRRG
jgi:hypothetical protein